MGRGRGARRRVSCGARGGGRLKPGLHEAGGPGEGGAGLGVENHGFRHRGNEDKSPAPSSRTSPPLGRRSPSTHCEITDGVPGGAHRDGRRMVEPIRRSETVLGPPANGVARRRRRPLGLDQPRGNIVEIDGRPSTAQINSRGFSVESLPVPVRTRDWWYPEFCWISNTHTAAAQRMDASAVEHHPSPREGVST